MQPKKRLLFVVCTTLGVVACGKNAPQIRSTSASETVGVDDPLDGFWPDASRYLADNISAADVGKTFGVDDAHIPYADSAWRFDAGGIDQRWNDGADSALAKYMAAVDPSEADAAAQWERQNHGVDAQTDSTTRARFDHALGWAGAAMNGAPVVHAIDLRLNETGAWEACGEEASGCTHFEVGDINALLAEVFLDARGSYLGQVCNRPPSAIARDSYGRVASDDAESRIYRGCQGINPGALVIALGESMKRNAQAVGISPQSADSTATTWRPAYRTTVYGYEALTEWQAGRLMRGFPKNELIPAPYEWNSTARGFVRLDLGITYVEALDAPIRDFVNGSSVAKELRVAAILELDRAPSDANAKIIGGEYIEDATVGASRTAVTSTILTIAAPPNRENRPTTLRGGIWANPYVSPREVLALAKLAAE